MLGTTLVLAGLFQFSRLKNACLTACRNPVGFLWQHYRRGTAAAWLVGARHGLSCLGCCWALMLVMFGTGVGGSLVWMSTLTAVTVVEKTTPWGGRIVGPVGVALLLAGITVAVLPEGVMHDHRLPRPRGPRPRPRPRADRTSGRRRGTGTPAGGTGDPQALST